MAHHRAVMSQWKTQPDRQHNATRTSQMPVKEIIIAAYLMARRTDGAVKDLGQVLGDLGKTHNKNIFHANFDQILFVGLKGSSETADRKTIRRM